MVEQRVGVGEERAVAGGERGDDPADERVPSGRPCGGAYVHPEGVLGGEGVELGGGAADGRQGGAVQAGQDVGLDDVPMNICDGDRGFLLVGVRLHQRPSTAPNGHPRFAARNPPISPPP